MLVVPMRRVSCVGGPDEGGVMCWWSRGGRVMCWWSLGRGCHVLVIPRRNVQNVCLNN